MFLIIEFDELDTKIPLHESFRARSLFTLFFLPKLKRSPSIICINEPFEKEISVPFGIIKLCPFGIIKGLFMTCEPTSKI